MCSITSRPPARRVHHINLAAAAVWFSSSLFPPLLAHWWRHYVCLNLFIPSLSLYVHDRAPLLNVLCMDSHFLVWSMAAYWSRSTLGNSVCAARLNIISLVLISPLGRPGNEYTSGPCTYTKCLGFFFSLSLSNCVLQEYASSCKRSYTLRTETTTSSVREPALTRRSSPAVVRHY